MRSIQRSCIAVDIVESHIRPIHNIQAPELRVLDKEVVDVDFGHVPKHERHWSTGLSVSCFCSVPDIAISIDTTRAIPVDCDVAAGDDEASSVVLECNWVRIVAPVVQVFRELYAFSCKL